MNLPSTLATTVLKAKKNSPRIFFFGGLAGAITSAVLACRATLKLETTLGEAKDNIGSLKEHRPTSEREYQRKLTMAYLKGAYDLAVLYGPSLVLGGLSVTLLSSSHISLSRRNAALTAAYTGMQTAFEEYRERVREAVGEDREREIYYGAQTVAIMGPDGETLALIGSSGGPYNVLFDETNANWTNSHEYNMGFLHIAEGVFTDRLNAWGYVTLNEVYKHLGFPTTAEGQIIGWTAAEHGGRGYLDFGLDLTCLEDSEGPGLLRIWVRLEPDGNILELI